MKILVVGLYGADPARLLENEHLVNLRRLMEFGCYGDLEAVGCPDDMVIWACMGASLEGNLLDDSLSERPPTIWEYLADQGKRAVILGAYPICQDPVAVRARTERLDADYPFPGPGSRSSSVRQGVGEAYDLSRRRFNTVRHLLCNEYWDYFQFVDSGLAEVQLAREGRTCDGSADGYYVYFDQQLGSVLESLHGDTIVLVVSWCGGSRMEGTPGSFVLAASNNPLEGRIWGVQMIDLAPTLLDLAGYEIPTSMQGRSLVAGQTHRSGTDAGLSEDDEEIVRQRLSGLGYIA